MTVAQKPIAIDLFCGLFQSEFIGGAGVYKLDVWRENPPMMAGWTENSSSASSLRRPSSVLSQGSK